MSKKAARKPAGNKKTLADREAYHRKALENIETRKQIETLRKKLKT